MADGDIEIPISDAVVGDRIFQESRERPVEGGGRRVVKMVPVSNDGTRLPCIWRSHYTIQAELSDGSRVPAYECLLLVSRAPILTMRAEIAIAAWENFGTGIVEW